MLLHIQSFLDSINHQGQTIFIKSQVHRIKCSQIRGSLIRIEARLFILKGNMLKM